MTVFNANYIPGHSNDQSFETYKTNTLSIHYRGLAYIPGYASDQTSIAELARQLGNFSLAECCHLLQGVYGLFVIQPHGQHA